MCSIERKYNKDMWIRISVKANREVLTKYYYLSFDYLKKEKDGDVVWETIQPGDERNFNVPIKYFGKYSSKRFNNYCNTLKEKEEELLNIYENIINGKTYHLNEILEVFNK